MATEEADANFCAICGSELHQTASRRIDHCPEHGRVTQTVTLLDEGGILNGE